MADRKWLVILFAVVALVCEWIPFRYSVLSDCPSLIATMLKGAVDVALLLVAYWWITPQYRLAILIPVWLLSVFFVINLWYFRVFGGLMPFRSAFMFGNIDLTLIRSIKSLWRWTDLCYLVIPTAYTLWLITLRRNGLGEKFTLRQKAVATVATMAAWIGCQSMAVVNEWRRYRSEGVEISVLEIAYNKYCVFVFVDRQLPHDIGLVHYFIKGLVSDFIAGARIDQYTPEQRQRIVDFVDSQRILYEPADTAFAANRDKNLILIIVESLNSEVVNAEVGGAEITPTLNRLIRCDGTINRS